MNQIGLHSWTNYYVLNTYYGDCLAFSAIFKVLFVYSLSKYNLDSSSFENQLLQHGYQNACSLMKLILILGMVSHFVQFFRCSLPSTFLSSFRLQLSRQLISSISVYISINWKLKMDKKEQSDAYHKYIYIYIKGTKRRRWV